MTMNISPEEKAEAENRPVLELKYEEAVKALKCALIAQAKQEQLLEKLENRAFRAQGRKHLAETSAEVSKKPASSAKGKADALKKPAVTAPKAAGTDSKRKATTLAASGEAHRVGEGSVPKVDNGDIWSKICNQNYSFQVREDVYDRFIFPWEAIEAGSKVVIYGGGIVGKIFLQQLQRASYCTVAAICDKEPESTGIIEAPVIGLKKLAGMSHDSYDKVLIAVEKKSIAREIRQDLELAGLPREKIVWVDPIREDLL